MYWWWPTPFYISRNLYVDDIRIYEILNGTLLLVFTDQCLIGKINLEMLTMQIVGHWPIYEYLKLSKRKTHTATEKMVFWIYQNFKIGKHKISMDTYFVKLCIAM